MAKASKCLIDVGLALSLREFLRKHGQKFKKGDFICSECGCPVMPMVKSDAGEAHFEHFKRNPSCSLSDKRTVRQACSEYKAGKQVPRSARNDNIFRKGDTSQRYQS